MSRCGTAPTTTTVRRSASRSRCGRAAGAREGQQLRPRRYWTRPPTKTGGGLAARPPPPDRGCDPRRGGPCSRVPCRLDERTDALSVSAWPLIGECRANARASSSGRRVPLAAEEAEDPGVGDVAVDGAVLAEGAFAYEAELLQDPGGRHVACVGLGLDAVQVQGVERPPQDGVRGLRGVAVAPRGGVEDVAQGRAAEVRVPVGQATQPMNARRRCSRRPAALPVPSSSIVRQVVMERWARDRVRSTAASPSSAARRRCCAARRATPRRRR